MSIIRIKSVILVTAVTVFVVVLTGVLLRNKGTEEKQNDVNYPVIEPNERLSNISSGSYLPYGVEVNYTFDGRFPKMPEKMLLYRLIRPKDVNETDVREMAKKHFDMPDDAKYERSRRYCNLNTESFNFFIDANTGFMSLFKHEKARDKLSRERSDYPSDEECKRIAVTYLKEHGLWPDDLSKDNIEYVLGYNLSSVGINVSIGGMRMSGYRTFGDGSELSVAIGVAGEIVRVSKKWIEYIPYKVAPIITPQEAFEELKTGRVLGSLRGDVEKMELMYFTQPMKDNIIQPVYCFWFKNSKSAYAVVPAVKKEYLKTIQEMQEESRQRRIQQESSLDMD